jgi:transaldolase/glucose-6-phosphate isomerase
MENRIRQIGKLGQAIWLDYISRDLIASGKLRALVVEGITGVTSNPTIFQKSISAGSDYDKLIRTLAQQGCPTLEIYETLAVQDVRDAADILRPIYNESHGRDGYVSLEVSPRLARDTDGTIAEARRLFAAVGRPNLMIKVPATPEGLPAIRTLIGDGINVNVTLIFAVSMYEKVMQAYLEGLEHLRDQQRPIGLVASVASFFVSRVDSLTDKRVKERIDRGDKGLESLLGQAAVANAKIAYNCYQQVFEGAAFAEFRSVGARVQRPLWASTGTKNPAYGPTKYVDNLIGPNTVNTVPPQTLDAIRQHALAARTIDLDVDQSYAVMERLKIAGIDMNAVTDELLIDGVKQFADSFDQLMTDLEAKRAKLGYPSA